MVEIISISISKYYATDLLHIEPCIKLS